MFPNRNPRGNTGSRKIIYIGLGILTIFIISYLFVSARDSLKDDRDDVLVSKTHFLGEIDAYEIEAKEDHDKVKALIIADSIDPLSTQGKEVLLLQDIEETLKKIWKLKATVGEKQVRLFVRIRMVLDELLKSKKAVTEYFTKTTGKVLEFDVDQFKKFNKAFSLKLLYQITAALDFGVDHGPGLDNHFPEHDSPEHDFHSYMKQGYNIENSNFLLGTPKIENGFIFSQLKVLMERLLEGRIASRAVNLPYFVSSELIFDEKTQQKKNLEIPFELIFDKQILESSVFPDMFVFKQYNYHLAVPDFESLFLNNSKAIQIDSEKDHNFNYLKKKEKVIQISTNRKDVEFIHKFGQSSPEELPKLRDTRTHILKNLQTALWIRRLAYDIYSSFLGEFPFREFTCLQLNTETADQKDFAPKRSFTAEEIISKIKETRKTWNGLRAPSLYIVGLPEDNGRTIQKFWDTGLWKRISSKELILPPTHYIHYKGFPSFLKTLIDYEVCSKATRVLFSYIGDNLSFFSDAIFDHFLLHGCKNCALMLNKPGNTLEPYCSYSQKTYYGLEQQNNGLEEPSDPALNKC